MNAVLSELEAEGRKRLREAGISDRDMLVERTADMRLVGQMHDIAVPLPAGPIDARTYEEIRAAFVKVYSARYTSVYEAPAWRGQSFRVRCVGPTPALSLKGAAGGADRTDKVKGYRRAWFEGGFADTTVYDRYALAPGDRFGALP